MTDALQPLEPTRRRSARESYHERGVEWIAALAKAGMHSDVSVDLHYAIILARTTWTTVFTNPATGALRVPFAVMELFASQVITELTDRVAGCLARGERRRCAEIVQRRQCGIACHMMHLSLAAKRWAPVAREVSDG